MMSFSNDSRSVPVFRLSFVRCESIIQLFNSIFRSLTILIPNTNTVCVTLELQRNLSFQNQVLICLTLLTCRSNPYFPTPSPTSKPPSPVQKYLCSSPLGTDPYLLIKLGYFSSSLLQSLHAQPFSRAPSLPPFFLNIGSQNIWSVFLLTHRIETPKSKVPITAQRK